jgi:hypothetical protein
MNLSQRCDPRKPAPPVIKTLAIILFYIVLINYTKIRIKLVFTAFKSYMKSFIFLK